MVLAPGLFKFSRMKSKNSVYKTSTQNVKLAMNNTLKTISIAVVSSLITLGGYKLTEESKTVVVEKVTAGYMASNEPVAKAASHTRNAVDYVPSFENIAEKVTPAVVHIRSTVTSRTSRNSPMPQYLQDIFGIPGPNTQPRQQESSGSGVIISADGYIVTNNHVVDQADEIEVILNDKRTFKATVIGTDPTTDLALIQIKAQDLAMVSIGNSDQTRVGEWVLAVGNPFNLESTVTAGIVSAKGRNINILRENYAIESFIQTDAAVNPGNSGGALVNMQGELIGINTAIASPTGSYSGYSFAIPSNITSKVVEDLMNFGTVQRAYLGIFINNLDGNRAKEMQVDFAEGVVVDSLVENGSAAASGILAKDIILAIDGKQVKAVPELQELIGRKRPGDEVNVTVWRKGSKKNVTVTLKNREGNEAIVKVPKAEVLKSLGAELAELSKDERKEIGEDGVKVKRLYSGLLRQQTDIQEGFIITRIDKEVVSSPKDVIEKLKDKKGGVLLEGVYPGRRGTFYYGIGLE